MAECVEMISRLSWRVVLVDDNQYVAANWAEASANLNEKQIRNFTVSTGIDWQTDNARCTNASTSSRCHCVISSLCSSVHDAIASHDLRIVNSFECDTFDVSRWTDGTCFVNCFSMGVDLSHWTPIITMITIIIIVFCIVTCFPVSL